MATSRSPDAPRPVLLLLTRPGCGLCEELRAELDAAFPGRFEIREACVDDRPDWRERYGMLIPVLLDAQGDLVCASRFDAARVAARAGAD